MQTNGRRERSGMYLLVMHVICFLLVVLYVNMFQFWAWVSRQLGPGALAKILPITITLLVLLCISLYFARRINRGVGVRLVFLGLGVVGAFLALAIPDPNVPIKRIHVAEYIILSFFVRYAMSHRLSGANLLLFSILATALYGVHDEMLQGLHPLRYYGWRDMIVNAVAGLSGALLGHGLVCFDNKVPGEKTASVRPVSSGQALLFFALLTATIWQVKYLYHHRSDSMSVFVITPICVLCTLIAFMYPGTVFSSRNHHGLQTVFWLCLALAFYPVIAGMGLVEFL